ncbi:MAG: reverse transcriptase domain-containing protein [Bacillota bacterium]
MQLRIPTRAEHTHGLVRYADDFDILCKLERKAERALEVAKQILEGQLKLKIHPEKTRVVHFRDGFDFLGCRFRGRCVGPRAKCVLSEMEQQKRKLDAGNPHVQFGRGRAMLRP